MGRRPLLLVVGLGVATLPVASDASGPPSRPSARLVPSVGCEPVTSVGRVRCEAQVRAEEGVTIRWADVQVLELPAFTVALKARLGADDASVREPGLWRVPFGIAARERGQGSLRARVRAVACEGERCEPVSWELTAALSVGEP